MVKYYFLLLSLFSSVHLFSQTRKVYSINVTENAPKIDGDLNDVIWTKCDVASEFTQTIPKTDQPSAYKSEVKMCYNNTSIFIAATLYQDKKIGSRQLTARDLMNNAFADLFTVFLDTYDDHQNGFAFRVSSAGVQQDERLSEGGEDGDVSWDAVWKSKVSLQDDRWQVEIEIPFSALRFAKQEEMKWGINFGRTVRKINENSFWQRIDVVKQGFLAQTGQLVGLKSIHPPVRLFLFPYLSTSILQQEESNKTNTRWLRSGGLDVKYGLNESFTLDLTLVPDFSQVISDNVVRNLSPFEQQLTENRPFFTEGTEMFNKADLFYSRRVGGRPSNYYDVRAIYADDESFTIEKNPNVTNLYNALKVSGRTKDKLGVAFFNAVAAPVNAKIRVKQTGEILKVQTEPLTNYNMLVLDQALNGQSSINFTNTNVMRKGEASDANVSSLIYTQFNKKENYVVKALAQFSVLHQKEYDAGSLFGLVFAKVSGKTNFTFSADRISPKFDKRDMGIQFEFNNMNQSASINYTENKPKSKHLQFYKLGIGNTWSENAVPVVFKYYQVEASVFFLFKSFWDIAYEIESKPIAPNDFYQLGAFGLRLKTYPYIYNAIGGSSDSRKKLFWNYYAGYGTSNSKHTDYVYINQGLRYRFSPKLDVMINGEVTRDNNNIGYAYYDDVSMEPIVGNRDVREYMGQLSVKLNLSPNTNFTARVRHYNSFIRYNTFHKVDALGEWRNRPVDYQSGLDENYNLQNIDVFFNWMFRPGSRLVMSYKQWLNDSYLLNNKADNSYFKNVHQLIKVPHAFEFALRVIYFLDYNQMKG